MLAPGIPETHVGIYPRRVRRSAYTPVAVTGAPSDSDRSDALLGIRPSVIFQRASIILHWQRQYPDDTQCGAL